MLRLLLPLVLSLVAFAGEQTIIVQPLAPEQIANLEAEVKRHPDDVRARLLLLMHYRAFPQSGQRARLNHILYFVERLPSNSNASIPLTYVSVADAGDHTRVRQAWMGALRRFPNDDRVLGNAVRFLYRERPQEAEQLLRQAVDRNPANRTRAANLGFLYALHLLGISSPRHTKPRPPPELHQQLHQSAIRGTGTNLQPLRALRRRYRVAQRVPPCRRRGRATTFPRPIRTRRQTQAARSRTR